MAGEIAAQTAIDHEKTVLSRVREIGFDSCVGDRSSVDCRGLSDATGDVLARINKQSLDIAGGVRIGKEDFDIGAGDRDVAFG